MSGTRAAENPLRYRGCYWDSLLGMYYLQSRYYDPVVGRFINADAFMSTGMGLLGYNMFAYCLNNPVNFIDPDGYIPRSIMLPTLGTPSQPPPMTPGQILEMGQGPIAHPIAAPQQQFQRAGFFNTCAQAVIDAQNYYRFNWYRGAPVIRHNFFNNSSAGIFGIIFLHRDTANPHTVRHERAHLVQEQMMGTRLYIGAIAIPSVLSITLVPTLHNRMPWERLTDWMVHSWDWMAGFPQRLPDHSTACCCVFWARTRW